MTFKMSKFNPAWLDGSLFPDWKKWLRRVENDDNSAKCILCKKVFSLSSMGRQSVKSHQEGKFHKQLVTSSSSSVSMSEYLVKPSNRQESNRSIISSVTTAPNSELASSTSTSCSLSAETSSFSAALEEASSASGRPMVNKIHFQGDSNVRRAEILWALHVVMKKDSFNSQQGISNLFAKMFPDSSIAQEMQLSSTKAAYLVTYGLAPYYFHKLTDEIQSAKHIVVCFDESFNRVAKLQQMDIAVRIWDVNKNQVMTRYWNSSFLGHSTADDLLEGFQQGLKNVELSKIVQVSMDGPNVNWLFMKKLKEKTKMCEEDPDILDLGSCGLHVVHGAFQMGVKKTGWEVVQFLKAIYSVFKDSPARRSDFRQVTSCCVFPIKFCDCRWLENVPVCERAIQIFSHLKKFFKTSKLPATYSIEKVKDCLRDPLLLAKLNFFLTVASSLEPFLRKFQTSKPMLPFLHNELEDLLRDLLGRFIKMEILKTKTTAYQLISIDLDDVSQGLPLSKLKIGFAAKHELGVVDVNELQKQRFLMECKTCMVQTAKKLIERSPIKYKMVKAASCLDPRKLLHKQEECRTSMDTCLQILMSAKHLTALQSDRASVQFTKFVSNISSEKLASFHVQNNRLDTFFADILCGEEEFKDLWIAVKIILILSHGNAFVESGFSINKEMLVENLHEESLIGLRRVWDGVSNAGGENCVQVDQEMIKYARGAASRYKGALEQKRQNEDEDKKLDRYCKEEKKRKSVEIQELLNRKLKIEKQKEELDMKIKKIKKNM